MRVYNVFEFNYEIVSRVEKFRDKSKTSYQKRGLFSVRSAHLSTLCTEWGEFLGFD